MVNAFSFSYTPKPSTALASITPIKLLGEGRESLRFTASTPMSFIKQNPEIVTEGFWKGRQALTEGIVKGGTSALSGITGALAQKAAEIKADADAITAHERAKEIANIKAAPTEAEKAYQQQRSDLLAQQIKAATVKNENVSSTQEDVVAEGDTSIIDEINSLISPAAKKVESAPPTQPSNPASAAPAASVAPPAAPVVPNAPVAPAGVSQFAPGDAGRGLFQFDRGTGTDVYGNVPPRQASMAFNLAPPPQTQEIAATAPVAENTPVATPESAPTRTIFGQSDNPNFTPLRENIRNRGVVSEPQPSVAPSQDLSFLDINSITPEQTQSIRGGFQLPVVESSSPKLEMPEVKEQLVLNGVSLPLAQVTGAEGKNPLAAVEPVLPTQVPSEPAPATTAELVPERTQEEIVNQYVGLLTNKPYRGAGDARKAKQVLEKLGLKAEIEVEKGEKGTRLHYVKVVDEAPPAKTAPEGFFTKKITDADGKETYVYEPKVPIDQQIKTIETGIDRAKTLKQAIADIRAIAGGISPGVGGAANLMSKLPFPTDASTVQSLNETIKGIIGFKELVDLKAAGGTLGALSDSELNMLTSLQGSLDVKNLHSGTYLKNLENIEKRADDVQKKLEAHQKDLMNVEKKTNFQPIKSETPKYQKGVTSFVKDGYKYVWDGTEFKLSK
jgi:hypothetical protein